MKTAGIHTLKDRLSEYVRAARSGKWITATSQSAPVADLVPHAPHGLDPDNELLRLARSGEVRLGRPDAGTGYPRPPKESRLPHDEVMALLGTVRSGR